MQIPRPTMGRIVLYDGQDGIEPAVILKVFQKPAGMVVLKCLKTAVQLAAEYGEYKPDHWWYPPRTDDTIEVEG